MIGQPAGYPKTLALAAPAAMGGAGAEGGFNEGGDIDPPVDWPFIDGLYPAAPACMSDSLNRASAAATPLLRAS
jgi:hypothetical protein